MKFKNNKTEDLLLNKDIKSKYGYIKERRNSLMI